MEEAQFPEPARRRDVVRGYLPTYVGSVIGGFPGFIVGLILGVAILGGLRSSDLLESCSGSTDFGCGIAQIRIVAGFSLIGLAIGSALGCWYFLDGRDYEYAVRTSIIVAVLIPVFAVGGGLFMGSLGIALVFLAPAVGRAVALIKPGRTGER